MLIEHHVKYKEIHGVDETVWMTVSDHRKLHHRLRKEKKCNVPIEDMRKITWAAYRRTPKGQKAMCDYRSDAKTKERQHNYRVKTLQTIQFMEVVGEHLRLHEILTYNRNTSSISWSSIFEDSRDRPLKFIQEREHEQST